MPIEIMPTKGKKKKKKKKPSSAAPFIDARSKKDA